jgi:hypothetical protein
MTSPFADYRTLPATEQSPTALQTVSAPTGSRADAFWMRAERRHSDRYEDGASATTAALFAGMLMGAGSTALMIWLTTLVF